ncbi:MAG: extracellular solute-binding protein, partial [Candidatus Limnocylindria bacterium]
MTSRRSTGAVITALVMTFALAACGRGEEGSGGASAPASQAPEVDTGAASGEISVWAMGTEGENLDVLADAYMAENPDVTVEVTAVPWDAAHDRIVNAMAGGEGPDVTMIGTTWMGEFAQLGGIDPTPSNIDSSQFFGGAWDTTVVDGTSYGVPWYVETRLLYYRTDLAEEGGVT